jgi:Peptidase S24-like
MNNFVKKRFSVAIFLFKKLQKMDNQREVTLRFIACVEQLKLQKIIRSYRQFACQVEFLPQSLSEIINQRRDVGVELIRKSIAVFGFNPYFLFTGKGDYFNHQDIDNQANEAIYEQMLYVPATAQAAYAQQHNPKRFLKELAVFSLPDFKYKTSLHRAFEVTGDSMETTLFEGDKVIANFISPEFWKDTIKNNYVYVLVSRNDIHIQRFHNQLVSQSQLLAIPDNHYYQPYPIAADMIKEIWYVRAKISPFLPSPQRVHKNLNEEMAALRQTLQAQSLVIQSLNQTVENLLNSKK